MKPLFPTPPPPPPMAHDPERAILVRRPLEERLLETLRYLSEEIELRRPGSLGEAQAAGYIAGRLNRADQQASVTPITTEAGTTFGIALPLLMGAIVSALAAALPGRATAIIPLVVLVLVPIIVWNEIEGRALIGALLGRRQSQNVVGVRAPIGTKQRIRVVLAAPLDRIPQAPARTLLFLGLELVVGQAILLVAWMSSGQMLLRWALILGSVAIFSIAIVILTMRLRGNLRPAIQGTGELAVLVAVAEELGELEQVELWTVALGAVSMGDSGMHHLLQRYPFEQNTYFINLHDLAVGQPAYVTREGMLREHRSDRRLLALASGADAADVSINAEPRQLRQHTLAALPLRLGYPTLTITTHSDQSGFTSTDPASLKRCVKLVVGMIRELDRLM